MKRGILLCLLALLLLLTACGGKKSPTVYEQDGYMVDLENRTIIHGEDVYTYTVSGSGAGSEIRITYPNGATYYWTWNGNFGHGGWSDDYDPARYADGDTLMELINFEPEPEKSGPSPLLAILLLAVQKRRALRRGAGAGPPERRSGDPDLRVPADRVPLSSCGKAPSFSALS